ncbi:MAG TPA: ADP-glyceromanno-heptose 6-epimerase [Gammaproteobacteria bacterium]|nr:ADP-glyceromanno-heptose 6-epimerase [Gammaproteobacteria bacterium]|tara:strand:- start:3233 stop:4177 length:945 start_codon:yes stop_codon:yes gene_type:complete
MIIVTGGAGFIGSNLVHELNSRGHDKLVVVDDLSYGRKFENIATATIADYLDVEEFRAWFSADRDLFEKIERVYHLGACSTTTEWNGRMMLDLNYTYSRDLICYCAKREIPIAYASSAAVYGGATAFEESAANEKPINVYGYSKLLLDRYVRRLRSKIRSQIIGLRYFNVYGPREQHKEEMASVTYHLNQQLLESGTVRLFKGSGGFAAGEQCRDFIYVDDAVNTTLWFADNPHVSGIFNCGTGRAESFNQLAAAVLDWHGRGTIEYIEFPDALCGVYQNFTEANMEALHAAGCKLESHSLSAGVNRYLEWLNA